MKAFLRDWTDKLKDRARRAFPGRHSGMPAYGLGPHQRYPAGTHFFGILQDDVRLRFSELAITPETPVASIGSCFSEEFASHFKRKRMNYLMIEPNLWNASADWGRVYTIPNLKQIVDYSIQQDYPVVTAFTRNRNWKDPVEGWFDPLRDGSLTFPDRRSAESNVRSHREMSHMVFRRVEALVITLGQNESWRDRRTGLVWAARPPDDLLSGSDYSFEFTAFDQVRLNQDLTATCAALFGANPGMKIILTLSPVPASATFFDGSIVTRSFAAKCLLRTVIQSVADQFPGRIFYYPSFEMVLAYNPHSYRSDNRHVQKDTVTTILDIFDSLIQKQHPV